jgi:hypothetical protein
MGDVFKEAEKIGQAVDEREAEDKKQQARLRMNASEGKNQKKNRNQDYLKWLNERNVSNVKKIKTDDIDDRYQSQSWIHLSWFRRRRQVGAALSSRIGGVLRYHKAALKFSTAPKFCPSLDQASQKIRAAAMGVRAKAVVI